MKKLILSTLVLFCLGNVLAQNLPPNIEIISTVPDFNNNTITLTYTLNDVDGDNAEITLQMSDDNGATYEDVSLQVTGDIGYPIVDGTKEMVWTPTNFNANYKMRIIADDLQPVDIQAIVDQVDSNSIWEKVVNLEGIRHRFDPVFLGSIQMDIEDQMNSFGLEVEIQELPIPNYVGKNIIGINQGKSIDPEVYIIDGHYDTVDDSPGADDNGTGVAGMLEAARILSNYHFDHTIKFIGFDLEEEGFGGSAPYVSNSLLVGENLKGVINLEMIGYFDDAPNSQNFPSVFQTAFPDAHALLEADSFRGNFITNVGFTTFTALQDSFSVAAAIYVPELKVIDVIVTNFSDLANQALLRSDHAPFWFSNRAAIMLTDGAEFRNPFYHTADDRIATLDKEFMTNVVKASVATLAKLAGVRNCSVAEADILLNANELDCNFDIYPNPIQDDLYLQIGDCENGDLNLEIYDLRGVLVFEKEITTANSSSITIDLQDLNTGLYILKIGNEEGFASRKLLVE